MLGTNKPNIARVEFGLRIPFALIIDEASRDGMIDIGLPQNQFQIHQAIIMFVPIEVIHFHPSWDRTMKRLHNNAMD